MVIDFCSKDKCVFMRASLDETPLMYMYSIFSLIFTLLSLFDKFEVNVLKELNRVLSQLHLNA